MKVFLSVIMGLNLLWTSVSAANQYDDLKNDAKEIPRSEIDAEVLDYISNETNEATTGMKSHYTLALYEDTDSGASWYILDGYYQLASGKILFLDFQYNPTTKRWWPIENYRYLLPGATERFMLEADELCNPYQRHFIGLLEVSRGVNQLKNIQTYFDTNYKKQPLFLVNGEDMLIIDPTKSTRMSQNVLFTLQEKEISTQLTQLTGLGVNLLPSGREPSTPEVKKTYVGVTSSCAHVGKIDLLN